mmetsp:Transcript_5012/g.9799  ORF Transcript_5012/g.9799 Transcript_5012/m.9799 type:complete len:238 (-) Transcript_5012:267-980(-)
MEGQWGTRWVLLSSLLLTFPGSAEPQRMGTAMFRPLARMIPLKQGARIRQGHPERLGAWGRVSERPMERSVSCHANVRRLNRVGKEIMREMSDLLMNDRHVLTAVDPDYFDEDRIANTTLASVSEVQMSRDLSVAKLYLLFSGGSVKSYDGCMRRLEAKKPYIRKTIAERLSIRRAPEIVFYKDNTLEEADQMKKILKVLKEDREKRETELKKHGFTTMEEFLNGSAVASNNKNDAS